MNFFSVVKFKRFSSLVVMVAAAVLSGPVASQPHGPSHHHGGYGPSSKHHGKWPQATLQAQARTEVAHDTVNIVLAAEISDDTQEAVAQALTQAVSTATDRALDNAAEGVKVRSGNFRVWRSEERRVGEADGAA